jgi:hypothetical protein
LRLSETKRKISKRKIPGKYHDALVSLKEYPERRD